MRSCSPPTRWWRPAGASSPKPMATRRSSAACGCCPDGGIMVLTGLALKPSRQADAHENRDHAGRVQGAHVGEIAAYVASGEGVGKAGGYAMQGRAEAFVRFDQRLLQQRRRTAAL